MADPHAEDRTPILRPVWPGEEATNRSPDDPEFISIPEWARRLGLSADSAYKAARLGQIPGCFAIGRLYRVNWTIFIQRAGNAPTSNHGADVDVTQEPTAPAVRPAASRLPR
jgi:hypothetical protein